MGKWLDNYIAVTAPASEMFGKLMSLREHVMMSYFETLTDIPQAELAEFSCRVAEGALNPRDVKMRMAREIVTEFYNAAVAQEAEEAFIRQFSERKLPVDIPDYQLTQPVDILTLLVDAKLAKSKGEARRLVQQGGVSFFPASEAGEPQHIRDVDFIGPTLDGAVRKVGKLHYIKIRI